MISDHPPVAFGALLAVLHRLRPKRSHILVTVLALLLAGSLEAAGVGLLVPLLSALTEPQSSASVGRLQGWFPGFSTSTYVMLLGVSVVGVVALKNVVAYSANSLTTALREKAAIDLRAQLFDRVLRVSIDSLEVRSSGAVANAFLSDAARTVRAFDFSMTLAHRGILAAGYFSAILVISWQLTLLTAALGLALTAIARLVSRSVLREGRAFGAANLVLSRRLTDTFNGLRTVRTTGNERFEAETFSVASQTQAHAESRLNRASALQRALIETLGVAGAMLLTGVAYRYLLSSNELGIPEFLAFGFGLIRLLPALNQIHAIRASLTALLGGVEATLRWLTLPTYPERSFGKRPLTTFTHSIRFEGVSYAFPNGCNVLRNVNFEIPARKVTALVGASGSGKTTIATLLLRLREPTEGRITFDGQNYWDFTPESFSKAVACVEQDVFMFEGTIYDNVAYGFAGATPEAVLKALEIVRLRDFVESLPNGLDTVLGERGTTVSGGQRQRLAIARALIRSPKVLVLDEPTAALDSTTEREVLDAIEAASAERTTLIITHRSSTIEWADKVVTLQAGSMNEERRRIAGSQRVASSDARDGELRS